MKIKEGFTLKNIVGTFIVLPIGKRVIEFNVMLTLSESGAVLWRKLEEEASMSELITTLLNEYDIDNETAERDIEQFINSLNERKLLLS